MKKRELNTLRSAAIPELTKMVKERRTRLQQLSFDLAAGKVKNVSELRVVRKEIAQLLTLIAHAEKASALPTKK